MCRNSIIKMKDGKLVTINCCDTDQIKELVYEYCGSEFSELLNCILDDFEDRIEDSDDYIY